MRGGREDVVGLEAPAGHEDASAVGCRTQHAVEDTGHADALEDHVRRSRRAADLGVRGDLGGIDHDVGAHHQRVLAARGREVGTR